MVYEGVSERMDNERRSKVDAPPATATRHRALTVYLVGEAKMGIGVCSVTDARDENPCRPKRARPASCGDSSAPVAAIFLASSPTSSCTSGYSQVMPCHGGTGARGPQGEGRGTSRVSRGQKNEEGTRQRW